MVDFIEALKRPFSDLNKLLIGTILGMIPLVNLTVTGYALRSTGFTKEKVKKSKLPEWNDFGDLFMKGLISCFIGFLLLLPAIIILIGSFGTVVMSPVISMMLGGISTETWNNIITGQITDVQFGNWFTQYWAQILPVLLSALPLLIVGAIIGFLGIYMEPVAILGWLKEKSFGAAFSWNILKKAFTLDYFVIWILVGALTGVVNFALGWIPFFGMGITMYVIGVFSFTAFSEVYEKV